MAMIFREWKTMEKNEQNEMHNLKQPGVLKKS